MNRKFIVYFGMSEVMRGGSNATITFLTSMGKVLDESVEVSIIEFVGADGREHVKRSWNNMTVDLFSRDFCKQLE